MAYAESYDCGPHIHEALLCLRLSEQRHLWQHLWEPRVPDLKKICPAVHMLMLGHIETCSHDFKNYVNG
jgi:hypothetical protein